jgi:hypothetical protein
MAKKLPFDPLSLVLGVGLGLGLYMVAVYGVPVVLPAAPLTVQGVDYPMVQNPISVRSGY